MDKGRLEAFSDGVFAVIITIMVLDLKAPHSENISSLKPLLPAFLCYILSYIYVGMYWNNHHHMLHAATRVNGAVLWANLHLLFWLSMFPFVTAWLGENHFAKLPTAVYGFVLLMAAISYSILQKFLISCEGENSHLAKAIGNDFKGKLSILTYVVAISITFYHHSIAQALYAFIAIMWLIPDRRIEKILGQHRD